MKAVILIGGKALRLRPLTAARPKAIVPLLSRPFLENQLALLRTAGITEIILCLAHLPRRIGAAFGDGSAHGVSLRYEIEPKPLDTGGAIGHIRSQLAAPFLCLNGDVLTDLDVRALVAAHEKAGGVLTLSVASVPNGENYGVVRTAGDPAGADFRVTGFAEKRPAAGRADISVGIYVMSPKIFDFIPPEGPISLEHTVFPAVVAAGRSVAAWRHSGYFNDIGTLDGYRAVHRDILDGRIRIPGVGTPNPGGVIVDESASVHPDARLAGPAFIGPEVQIRNGARVGPYAVLGRRVRIESDARVTDSILWEGTRIGEGAEVSGTIVGVNGFIGPGAQIRGAALGDKSILGAHSKAPWNENRTEA